MLRKRWNSGTPTRYPATCHQAIPDLKPNKRLHGMATMDYTLMVCGGTERIHTKGMNKESIIITVLESNCHF